MRAGLKIEHHRFGRTATSIVGFEDRLVCSNGLVSRVCHKGEAQRTRRLPASCGNSRQRLMAQVRALTIIQWQAAHAQLDGLRKTTETTVEPPKLMRRWLREAGLLTDKMLDLLMDAWHREGEENTLYGVVNAISFVATHSSLSERKRRILASMAGLLAFSTVHICDRCMAVITRNRRSEEREV